MLKSDNVPEFKKNIEESKYIKNVDSPEAGLDAIAQAMRCDDTIGWKNESRTKIIAYISDGEMHFALDGLLGGITENFNGDQCYLNKTSDNDYYFYDLDHQKNFDYPSIGQVSVLVFKKKKISIK